MDDASCLIFELDPYRYALPEDSVAGVIDAPPMPAQPAHLPFVCGAVQYQDEVLPVIDLHRLLGQPPLPSHDSGHVIVLQGRRGKAGLLASNVIGLRLVPERGAVRMRDPGGEKPQGWKYVSRLVAMDHALVMVLDAGALLATVHPDDPKMTSGAGSEDVLSWTMEPAPDSENAADRLTESLFEDFDAAGLVAVIAWSDRRYGILLSQVEEFREVTHMTRLPGCPPHILGQSVLRGEPLTVVDVRPVLGMDLPAAALPLTVVVVLVEDEWIGIVVDEVREILTTRGFVASPGEPPSFVTGSVPYGGGNLEIVDLLELLSSEAVVVDQYSQISPGMLFSR